MIETRSDFDWVDAMAERIPRHDKILALVKSTGFMPIEDLAKALDVTSQTIRRDITRLCENNLLRRYHGGVSLKSSVDNDDYLGRHDRLPVEKMAIGELTAKNIANHASIFLSIGTTIEAVSLALLKNHKGLRIITNNIHAAAILSSNPDFTVMITSGVVRASDGGITGVATLDFIKQFKVDYAILSASGVEEDGSLLDYDYREVRVAQAMMANARQKFLVVDHSKFGRHALVKMATCADFDALFTDAKPNDVMLKLLEHAGVACYVSEDEMLVEGTLA